MYERHCRAIDVAEATGISASAICRYISGTNKPSSDKLIALAKYLLVSPEWLLDSSEAHMLDYSSKDIAKATEPLLKQIELQDKLIKSLEKQNISQSHFITALFKQLGEAKNKIEEWEDWKASSKERHAKGQNKAFDKMNKADQNAAKATRKRKK